jgi:hypothetical protein
VAMMVVSDEKRLATPPSSASHINSRGQNRGTGNGHGAGATGQLKGGYYLLSEPFTG